MANVGWVDLTTAPAGAGFDDNADQTTGCIFTTGATRDIIGVAFYLGGGTPTVDREVAIWVNGETGEPISGTRTTQAAVSTGWNLVPFASPVEFATGTQYIACYWAPAAETDSNGYWSDNGAFSSSITLNDLTAIADADDDEAIGNGRFKNSSLPMGYPNATFNSNNYMCTPYYDDGAAGPVIVRRRQLTTVRL